MDGSFQPKTLTSDKNQGLSPAFLSGTVQTNVFFAQSETVVPKLAAISANVEDALTKVSVPAHPAARVAFVKKFNANNVKRVLAGLPLLVLLLPDMAAAQSNDFVNLNSVEGVANATVLDNGNVRVTLDNGRRLTIDADAVEITPNGEILVSQAAVGAIGEAVLLATGGGAGAGGAIAGLLGGAAALGGGGGGGGGGSAPVTSGGRVVDGYISGATVFRDLNDNGVFDAGEPNVLTDNEGNFTGLAVDSSNPNAKILAVGGTDIATGKAFVGTLSAPADATVVTPITTLVQALVEKAEADGSPITAATAAAQVTSALGLGSSDVLNEDPVAAAEEGDLTALKAATQIANVINLAAAADSNAPAASAQAAESLADALVNNNNRNNPLNDETTLQSVMQDAVGAAKANDLAAAASNANTVIDKAANDETGLTQIEQVLTVVQGDVVDDVKAGNEVGTTDIEAEASAIVPLRPTLDRGDTEINAASKANGIGFSGTGRPGTEITVDFGGATKTTTTAADGSWSVNYTSSEFPADPAGGTVTVSVTAKENPSDPPSPAATRTISLDSTAPAAPGLDPVAGDGTVNGAEAAAGFTATGTGEAGATVAVTMNAGGSSAVTKSVSVANDGTWSATFGASEVPADGAQTIEAVQTDAVGNSSPTANGTFTVDTAATAQPTIATVATDDIVNASEKAAGVAVTGTAEANASVAVTFGATTKTVTAAGDGSYSASFTEAEMPGDGLTNISVVATDAVGNASPAATRSVELNTAPPGAPTFNAIATDDVVNLAEAQSALTFSGTVPTGSSVSVTFNGTTIAANVDGSGNWTADLSSAGLPSDGQTSVSATATDGNGNTATSSRSFLVDTATATPTINAVSGDDLISAADAAAGVSVTGTAEAGASVAVTIAGGATHTVTADAAGNFAAAFSSADLPGNGTNIQVSAVATDAAGNTATGTRSIVIDSSAPTTPSISVISNEGTINLAEAAAGVNITGSAEAGTSVAVTFGSFTKTVTADAGGGFSAAFSSRELPEDGTYTVNAVATDSSGNVSPAGSASVTVDTKAPPVPTINVIAGDDVVNATEKLTPSVTGTAEANATVIVKAGDTTKTTTADGSGNWSVSFTQAELPATDITGPVTARAVDASGNQSTAALREVTFDTVVNAPVINAVGATTPDLVNAAEKAAGLTVTGTAEVGATVTLTLAGTAKTATAAADGTWSVSFTAAEQPVTDGVYALTASAVDTAGNTTASPGTRPITYDTAAPAAPVVNTISSDNVLNSGEVTAGGTVTGTAEANATITVDFRVPATVSGGRATALQESFESRTTQADGNGDWTLSWTSADFPEGTVVVGATATDAAGNSSTETTVDVTVDLTPPTGSIGTVATDDVVSKTEADAGFSVDVTAGSDTASVQITVGTTTKTATLSGGTYSATFVTAELPNDGTHSISATLTDAAGNTSTVTRSVVIETQPPAAPVIDDVTADNVVNAAEAGAALTVTGTAEAGSTVAVTLNSNTQTATADATTGVWSVSFASGDLPTTDGTHQISATATDAANNTSVAGTKDFTLDTSGPAAPSFNAVATDDVINAIEQAAGVDVTGSTEAGASVSVTMTPSGGSPVTKTATANGSGTFSVNFTSAEIPTSGSVDFVATATDTAGNQGTTSSAKTVTINTTSTATPLINAVTGDNFLNASEVTSDVTISGSAEAGASVSFTFGTISRTLTADASTGVWTTTIASGDLPSEGTTNVVVTATGGSGVQSAAATQAVVIDTSAPVAPSVAAFGGDGVINAAEAAAGIDITGTGEPGSTITVDIPTGSNAANGQTTLAVKTSTVDGSGNWSVSFTGPELPAVDGPFTVSATQTDQAGNTSPAGTATFTLDTIAPVVPTVADLGDNLINATEFGTANHVTGSTEALASVSITVTPDSGTPATYSTTADGSGNFSFPIVPSDFSGATSLGITVTATDAAGNTSAASAVKTLTIDTSTPNPPTVDSVTSDDVVNAAEASAGVTISGTAEPGAVVSFSLGGGTISATADATTGVWSTVVASGDLPADGSTTTFFAVATDAAGNQSSQTSFTFSVDTTPPSAPTVAINSGATVNAEDVTNGVTVSGTGEPGATVTVNVPLVATPAITTGITSGTFPFGTTKTVIVDGSGNWSAQFAASDFPANPPVDGIYITAAFQTDAAGNQGGFFSQGFAVDTTPPAAPTIDAVATDNVIDDAEHGAGVSVTGSTTANADVTVVMTPTSGSAVTKTVTADGSGNYSASFTTAELPTSGTATFTATVSDAAGNTATGTQAVPVFTGATATPTVDTVAGDGIVNSAEAASPVVISGTAEDGASVAINFSTLGLQTVTATGGVWSYSIAPGALPSDGSTETFSVVATGQSGVPSTQASGTFTVNTSGPTLSIDNVTSDNIVNGTEYDAGITVTGTTDTNSGTIDVTIGSVTKTVSPTGGTWSASFTGAELGADGAKTVSVSQVDGANTGTASANFTLDAIAEYTVTIPTNSDHAWLDTVLDQNATVANPTSTSFELVGVAPFNTVGATGMKAVFTGTGFTNDGLVPPSILSGTVTDVAIQIDTGSGFNEAFRINGISFDLIAAVTASGTEIAGGGTGLNTIYGLFDPYKIHFEGSAQDDRLNGGQNGDLINGNDGDDNLFGFQGANTLNGGAGNDLLNNGADAGETFDGGADTDTLVYDLSGVGSPAAVNVDFGAGTAALGTDTDSVTNVENLRVLGSSNVTFSGDGQANSVVTDDGNDNISTGGGNDTVDSGSGNDTIDTGAGDDTIIFDPINTGAKTVSDSSGSDTIVIVDNPGLDDGGLVQDGAGNVVFTSAQTGSTITFAAGSMEFMRWESAAGSSNPYTSTLAISTATGTINADNTWVAGTSGADTIALSEVSPQTTTIGGAVSGGAGADNITLNLSNFAYAMGGAGADTLTSTGTGNVGLNGDAGNDTITGSTGDDSLRGGDDNDSLIGGAGDDYLHGGAGTDTVVLSGALADYTISISGTTVTLVNGSETDTVVDVENFQFSDQTVAFANLNPSVATRTITFLQGADAGLLADNTFLDPTAVFSTDGSGTQLSLTKTNVTDFGGQTVVGTLTGTGFTFDANDDPTGGTVTGSSYSVGGTVVMTTTELNVSLVQLGTALQNAQNGDFAALQAIYNNVPINVIGSSGDDRRDGNDANDTFNGNGGNDYFDGRGGNDTLNGGDGDDWLEGRDGNDSLVGGAGDDELHAGDNNDTLIGGAGRDHLEGHEGNDLLDSSGDASDAASQGFGDIVLPGEGNDTIIGHAEAYAATAGGGVDLIYENLSSAVTVTFSGTQGSGTATGTGKSDTFTFVDHVEGTNFADTFTGSAGGSGTSNDRESWVGEAGNDTIDGNGGTDMVQYYLEGGQRGVAVDLASGSAIDTYGDVDTLINIDWAQGTDLADVLIGDANDNFLHGRDGTDAINMGAGNDFVRGGSGGDLFLYTSGHDTIADFELGIDEIDLTQTGANMADIQLALSQATESTTAVSGVTSVIIPIDANNSLTLGGVTLAEIQAAAANLDGVLARSISVLTNDTQSYNFDTFFIEPILAPTDPVVFVNGNELTFTQRGPNNNFGQDIVARVVGTGFTFNGNDPFQPTGGRITAITIELNGQPVIVTQEPGIELTDFITGVAASTNQNTAAFNDVFSDYRVNVTGSSASVFVPDPIQFGSTPFMDFYSLSTQNDNASGGDGNDFINGDAGNDDLSGNNGDDFILGEAGEDYLNGGAGDDYLHGGADDDYFEPGAGDDVVIGGAGDHDTVSYESSNGAVNVNLADGTASDGESGTDTLVEIERARGGRFADTLTGDDGRNVFAGNAGNDTMDGGDGVDRVRYDREFRMDGSTQGVTVDLGAGTATDSFGNADSLISIERATGTEWDDSLTGSTEDNDLEGDGGNDTLTGGAGNDWMEGGRGFDHFVIGSGHNTIADFQLGIDSLEFDLTALGITQAQLELAFANNTQATLSYVEVSFGGNNSLRFEGLSETEMQTIPLDGQQVTPTFTGTFLAAGADTEALFGATLLNSAAAVQVNGGTITVTSGTGETAVVVIEDPDIRIRNGEPDVRGGTLTSITFSDAGGTPQLSLTGGEIAAMPFVRAITADADAIQNGGTGTPNLDIFLSGYTQIHQGNSGADFIGGRDGNDIIFGNDGDDSIVSFTGDDVIIAGGGNDFVVLGQVSGTDAGGNPIFDLNSADGSNRVEATLSPSAATDIINVLGFDLGAGADQDFVVLTAPGANPSDLGISKVTLTSGLRLQDAGDPNVFINIFTEVENSLNTQGVVLGDDAVEVVLISDGTDSSVVHLDVSDPNAVVATPLVNLADLTNLNDLENQILYSTPTV